MFRLIVLQMHPVGIYLALRQRSTVLRHKIAECRTFKNTEKTQIMIKKVATVIVAVVLAGLLSQSALADVTGGGPGGSAPDTGSIVLLFSMAIGGLAAVKRFLR